MKFNEEEANYQENLFFKHNVPTMTNRDIFEAVGLEYVPVDYSKKAKGKK